ncbi:CCA tRNA nucleotidyltransferase [bacterium]|nr:CCA tRNA nucleotidyltransferase [bacterium]
MIFSLFKRKTAKLPKGYQELISPDAMNIVSTLKEAGFETYLVGGCVRDILLKRPSKDFDIATSAGPEQVKKLLHRSQIIGRRFKIVVARRRLKPSSDLKRELFPVFHDRPPIEEFQITTFRSKPAWDEEAQKMNENVYGSAKEDAYRRDFTINALFMDPTNSKVVDYVGGSKDIEARLLRVIGDPRERFKEDSIRILRALRFAKRNDLKLESDTKKALLEQMTYLRDAKKERIREEILKIWREGVQAETFQEMKTLGLWKHLSPLYARNFETHKEDFKKLLSVGKAVSKTPWNNPRLAAPFFFLMAPDFFLGGSKKGKSHIDELIAKLNVSKKEYEDMQAIRENIQRLGNDRTKGARFFRKHPRSYEIISQSMYVLKILGDAGDKHCSKLWKKWERPWVVYKNECATLFGKPRGGHPRRRTRKRRPPR